MSNGWIFYSGEPGNYRHFTVGVEDEETAKLAVQTEHPDINILNFVGKYRADADLIKFLGLEGGKVMEWKPTEPGQEIAPRGSDIDSDYDPLRKK